MKTNPAPGQHTHTPTHTAAVGLFFCSLTLILSCALSPAQTPTPTPIPPPDAEADPLSAQEILLPQYQPSIYSSDPSTLRRIRIKPPASYGTGPWPTAITIHGGEFKEQDAKGTMAQRWADKDLANAGFLVFSIDYRLAPPGFILNQDRQHTNPADGRPPEQGNDVEQQILAAYNDPDCNKKIFLVGGSAGATHALWCALNSHLGLVPGWPVPGPQIIKAVVGLSGPYDLASRVGDTQNIIDHFAGDTDNYTNSQEGDGDRISKQNAASPYYLVDTATNIPPIRLFTSTMDPVPHQQAEEMRDKLRDHGGVDYLEYEILGNLHAFNYWHTMNTGTGNYVSQDVISFFNAHKN